MRLLSGQVHLMWQLQVLPNRSRPEEVRVAACHLVERRGLVETGRIVFGRGYGWSRRATRAGPWPTGPPKLLWYLPPTIVYQYCLAIILNFKDSHIFIIFIEDLDMDSIINSRYQYCIFGSCVLGF
jgi:hypothetical protein